MMDHDPLGLSTAADEAAPRLYPGLLGAAWDELHPALQRVHANHALTHAEGLFQVSRAPGRLLGLLLDLAQVPRAADSTRVQLALEHRGAAEHWRRVFEGRPLVTVQTAGADGLLIERMGLLEFRLRLAVKHGELLFRQQSLAIRLGSLRVRLPHWLAIQVAAREAPASQPDRTKVEVRVMTPTGSPLFSYRGTVCWTERGDAR